MILWTVILSCAVNVVLFSRLLIVDFFGKPKIEKPGYIFSHASKLAILLAMFFLTSSSNMLVLHHAKLILKRGGVTNNHISDDRFNILMMLDLPAWSMLVNVIAFEIILSIIIISTISVFDLRYKSVNMMLAKMKMKYYQWYLLNIFVSFLLIMLNSANLSFIKWPATSALALLRGALYR